MLAANKETFLIIGKEGRLLPPMGKPVRCARAVQRPLQMWDEGSNTCRGRWDLPRRGSGLGLGEVVPEQFHQVREPQVIRLREAQGAGGEPGLRW